jgi:hypothetical protein
LYAPQNKGEEWIKKAIASGSLAIGSSSFPFTLMQENSLLERSAANDNFLIHLSLLIFLPIVCEYNRHLTSTIIALISEKPFSLRRLF